MMRYLGGTWTPDKVAEALQEWHEDWGVDNRWYGVLERKGTLRGDRHCRGHGEHHPRRTGTRTLMVRVARAPEARLCDPRSPASCCASPPTAWEQRGWSPRLTPTTPRPNESSRSSVSSVSASGTTRMPTCPDSTHRSCGNRPEGPDRRGLLERFALRDGEAESESTWQPGFNRRRRVLCAAGRQPFPVWGNCPAAHQQAFKRPGRTRAEHRVRQPGHRPPSADQPSLRYRGAGLWSHRPRRDTRRRRDLFQDQYQPARLGPGHGADDAGPQGRHRGMYRDLKAAGVLGEASDTARRGRSRCATPESLARSPVERGRESGS